MIKVIFSGVLKHKKLIENCQTDLGLTMKVMPLENLKEPFTVEILLLKILLWERQLISNVWNFTVALNVVA